ncbi:MAG: sigma-54-dependent Fis family transcriptional regulator, partial [Mailhella sp.]|nr:sigma-54-dependent Fis family transcriptional regulator [Mailhella sp.]
MPHSQELTPNSDVSPWLETLRLMASEMGPKRPFQASLTSLLHKLSERHGFLRPHLVLFDPETGMLRLSLADAQPREKHGGYAPGVGVTGQVFATGRSVIVEKLKGDKLFLSLLFERSDEEMERLSFISVPILAPMGEGPYAAREVIGTLNADTVFVSREDLEQRRVFMEVAAAMIANEAAYLQEDLGRQRRLPAQRGESGTDEGEAFVAQSKVMRHILEQVAHIAQGRAPVLLCGEPGVGKERLAERIHASSPRSDVPLVVCHCGTIPPERLLSELCGYQKGAFLGAMQTQKGLFEQANTGTVFLGAVDALTPAAQEALLRLIKEHRVLRQGGSDPVPVDVRLITATSASLEQLVEQGRFSRELYERLNACALHVPPLRERREDIVPLVEHLLKRLAGSSEEQIKRISFPALELMTRYFWPGNIS